MCRILYPMLKGTAMKYWYDILNCIRNNLFKKADSLGNHPYTGQKEEYLEHLDREHRRVVEGYFKIIYRVENQTVYITDFFDTRQDPTKMKG